MKKSILQTLFIAFFPLFLLGQNNIILNIHHKLGDETFELDKPAKNNMDHDFKVKRIQYYLCDFTIIHDGGVETPIKDSWMLADGSESTTSSMGEYDINTVERIRFSIGVEEQYNHSDPASYDADHPLAPKVPSMHWGWAAGYRFIAFEGFGGNALNRLFELHGLGDNNLFTVELEVTGIQNGNNLVINLDADYTRALEDISVESGVIVHGDYLQAKQCLENMRDYVFSASDITSNVKELTDNNILIYPNPVPNGVFTLEYDSNTGTSVDLDMITSDGKVIFRLSEVSSGQTIDVTQVPAGIYFVNLKSEDSILGTKKLYIR